MTTFETVAVILVLCILAVLILVALAKPEMESCEAQAHDEVVLQPQSDYLRTYLPAMRMLRRRDFGRPKSVYISGPMTGLPGENFAAFDEAAALLELAGFDPVNPAEMSRQNPGQTYEWYLERDLAALKKCDAILLLPGWTKSPGAQREYHAAKSEGLEIVELHPDGKTAQGKYGLQLEVAHV